MVTLHIDNIRGKNAHHQIETIFKAFGRALRMAMKCCAADHIPSTKGVLGGVPQPVSHERSSSDDPASWHQRFAEVTQPRHWIPSYPLPQC